jgi:hypothetical protein
MKKILLLTILVPSFAFGQDIKIFDMEGNSSFYSLNDVQKINFLSEKMIIKKRDKSTSSYLINNLKTFSFENILTNKESLVDNNELFLYPNPVNNYLNLAITEACTISILNLKGEILIIKNYLEKGEKRIILESLSSGFYLCHYASNKEVKTVKIIKK